MKILLFGNGNIGQRILSELFNDQSCLGNVPPRHIFLNIEKILVLDKNISEDVQINNAKINYREYNILNTMEDILSENWDIIINCLPYYLNERVIQLAEKYNINYFDLSEDTNSIKLINTIVSGESKNTNQYIPCCGLAPGIINMLGQYILSQFEKPESLCLRVGALPLHSINPLSYSLNWSPDGLINEFTGHYHQINNNLKLTKKLTLINNHVENIIINGREYEAIETSGGIGTMVDTCSIPYLNYKTIRYRGHMDAIHNFLKIYNDDVDALSKYMQKVANPCNNDVVLIFVSGRGRIKTHDSLTVEKNIFIEKRNRRDDYKAIHFVTAHGLLGVLELFIRGFFKKSERFIKQENIPWDQFLTTSAGKSFNEN
jgi:saccharopine dehydrogenase (NAD+, L-lysine-forming)